jgi:hypothetical protein
MGMSLDEYRQKWSWVGTLVSFEARPTGYTAVLQFPHRLRSQVHSQSRHWRTVATQRKKERTLARTVLEAHLLGLASPVSATITLTRIAPKRLDDDNLQTVFKSLRDGVADWLEIDDGSPQLTWCYAQAKGQPREYAVRIGLDVSTQL